MRIEIYCFSFLFSCIWEVVEGYERVNFIFVMYNKMETSLLHWTEEESSLYLILLCYNFSSKVVLLLEMKAKSLKFSFVFYKKKRVGLGVSLKLLEWFQNMLLRDFKNNNNKKQFLSPRKKICKNSTYNFLQAKKKIKKSLITWWR